MQVFLIRCSGTQTTTDNKQQGQDRGGIEEKEFYGEGKGTRENKKENVIKVHNAFLGGYVLDKRINYN